MSDLEEIQEWVMALDCEGDWCGKSPNKFNNYDGRCEVCKKQEEIQNEREARTSGGNQ